MKISFLLISFFFESLAFIRNKVITIFENVLRSRLWMRSKAQTGHKGRSGGEIWDKNPADSKTDFTLTETSFQKAMEYPNITHCILFIGHLAFLTIKL